MRLRLTSNRKLLIGFGVQITTFVLYIAVILSYDALPDLIKAAFLLSFVVAGILLILGVIEDDKLRKLNKTRQFPESH